MPGKHRRLTALFGLLGLILWSPPSALAGETLKLEMPIHCTPGQDCWIVNYVDTDPSKAVSDYTCGKASYDGHKGIDIAIRDAARMRKGVPVYASAAGIVRGARSTMKDIDVTRNGGRQSVAKKECGNGVLIDNGNGWTTQYCHMLKGSIVVRRDDTVATGQRLGLIGLSGLTQFPHIHLQVKYKGRIVDPFIGIEGKNGCGVGKSPLWSAAALAAMPYRPTAIYNAGFASAAPNPHFARGGLYAEKFLLDTAPAMALWADMFWIKAGDKMTFLMTGPKGHTVISHAASLKKTQARRFAFAGVRRKGKTWQKGTYTGRISLIRPATGETFSVLRTIDVN